ncbi:MAG: hypothetical protein WKF89_20130, partial [Chitinophagaceae bacterium]
LSYNYKTINYYVNLTDSSIFFTQDYDCEEKDPESKKLDEKNDKKDISEISPSGKSSHFAISHQLSFRQISRTSYPSTDYSLGVYSPPEHLYI